jgi:hypothetical protein
MTRQRDEIIEEERQKANKNWAGTVELVDALKWLPSGRDIRN